MLSPQELLMLKSLDELNNQACHFLASNEYEKAIFLFSKLIECTHLYPEVYKNRGESYYYSKQYRLAINDFDTHLSLGHKYSFINAFVFYYRSLAKKELEDFVSALKDINMAISLNQNVPNFFIYARVELYKLMKLFPKAIDDCNTITQNNPLDEDSYIKRAEIYLESGNKSAAAVELFKAYDKMKKYEVKSKKIKESIQKYLNHTIND